MRGFTLIEILIVIGIIAILMAAALVAVNPFRQFALANNANRWSGVTTLMNAVYQNVVEHAGEFYCPSPPGGGDIPTSVTLMGSAAADYDICECIVGDPGDPTAVPPIPSIPSYVAAMPYDPQTGSYSDCDNYATGYDIIRDATTGRITISAPDAQLGETISITR